MDILCDVLNAMILHMHTYLNDLFLFLQLKSMIIYQALQHI